ncbi:thioredoxin domain-containing protein [Sulfurimonas sp.]|nr:thioredoxin domain-containing protein [Sulfurimonas sp.]
MLKLLVTTLLLSSVVFANSNEKIERFLAEKFKENPAIASLKVQVVDRMKIRTVAGWDAVVVVVDATIQAKPKNKQVHQKMIWFTNGEVITKELTNINTGESLKDSVNPVFKDEYYTKHNLIYGKPNAKYKVAIFSDPLCPFCGTFVPEAIEEMKKQPEKFAIYYYHFPLPTLHPAAVPIAKAAIAADLGGIKNVALRIYNMKIDPHEKNMRKILETFNRKLGTDIKASDLSSTEVQETYKNDLRIAEELMVNGTPTMFFNGKLDRTKRLYQRAP